MTTAVTLAFLVSSIENTVTSYESDTNDAAGHLKFIEFVNGYNYLRERHGGQIGFVYELREYAEFIERCLEKHIDAEDDFPGVFEYEVVEDLGTWIVTNPKASFADFQQHAARTIDDWFRNGLAAHPDTSCGQCVGCLLSAALSGATVHPTLKSSQPVEEEKEESTMKINDLINSLATILRNYGNVDVVVRGSKDTSFVDAQEVRAVKTSKRQTVYIGKTSAKHAQE